MRFAARHTLRLGVPVTRPNIPGRFAWPLRRGGLRSLESYYARATRNCRVAPMRKRFAPSRMHGSQCRRRTTPLRSRLSSMQSRWTAKFSRAWIELGWVYSASADKSSALNAFQKAAEADPKQVIPYKILAFDYMFLGNRDNAIATWQSIAKYRSRRSRHSGKSRRALHGPEALLGGSVTL